MRQPRPFYPPLFALFPVLSVYSANVALLPLASVWRPALIAAGFAVALWAVLFLILRDLQKSAMGSSVATLCCFGYGALAHWTGFPPSSFKLIALWAVATAGLAAIAMWRLRSVRTANLFAAALIVAGLAQVGYTFWRSRTVIELPSEGQGIARVAAPDIFYIILDGYGRSDAIQRSIGFSNSKFIDGLKRRGFYIADNAHSNYCQTELSLASSLNMDFIQALLPGMPASETDRLPLDSLLNQSRFVADMKSRGYRFIAITTEFPAVRFSNADVQLKLPEGKSLLEATLIQMTPLIATPGTAGSLYDQRRDVLATALRSLESLAAPAAAPRLVVAHILAPHPPFVFGPSGEQVPHRGLYGYWDGSDYLRGNGTEADYKSGYAGQAKWLDDQVLAALDKLLAGAKQPPIILVQGDHGSKLHLDQESLERTDVTECFPILSAYLVPDHVRKQLYPEITPVNSLRILSRVLFGANLPNLPDRSWYSKFGTPYGFTEVTDRIEPPSGSR